MHARYAIAVIIACIALVIPKVYAQSASCVTAATTASNDFSKCNATLLAAALLNNNAFEVEGVKKSQSCCTTAIYQDLMSGDSACGSSLGYNFKALATSLQSTCSTAGFSFKSAATASSASPLTAFAAAVAAVFMGFF
ncbi:hypothetical protein HDU76_004376 [Blyttiomyces sp. JEL0837]|nr:hypothetical protein HDU76_004376 [Blyttiomyces sp. JEL0837]